MKILKHLNLICFIGYIVYIAFYFVTLLIDLIVGGYTSYIFSFGQGIFVSILAILLFIGYNLFLFWFVFWYCKEKKYPGWVWMLIVLMTPYFFGLIAYIAIIRFPKEALKFYNYLITPDENNKII